LTVLAIWKRSHDSCMWKRSHGSDKSDNRNRDIFVDVGSTSGLGSIQVVNRPQFVPAAVGGESRPPTGRQRVQLESTVRSGKGGRDGDEESGTSARIVVGVAARGNPASTRANHNQQSDRHQQRLLLYVLEGFRVGDHEPGS